MDLCQSTKFLFIPTFLNTNIKFCAPASKTFRSQKLCSFRTPAPPITPKHLVSICFVQQWQSYHHFCFPIVCSPSPQSCLEGMLTRCSITKFEPLYLGVFERQHYTWVYLNALRITWVYLNVLGIWLLTLVHWTTLTQTLDFEVPTDLVFNYWIWTIRPGWNCSHSQIWTLDLTIQLGPLDFNIELVFILRFILGIWLLTLEFWTIFSLTLDYFFSDFRL